MVDFDIFLLKKKCNKICVNFIDVFFFLKLGIKCLLLLLKGGIKYIKRYNLGVFW